MASVVVAAAVGFGVGPAKANHVACGDTITADTTLDSDVFNCPNNGIVIGADDITLDLNGHTVTGDGEPVKRCPRGEPCDIGVLSDGHHGVTMRNGSVRKFGTGVVVARARHNRVLSIASSRNQFFGFAVIESTRTVVRDSSGNDNPAPDGDGLGVFGSHHLRILHNSFRRNGQIGIHVEASTNILIERNLLARNPDFGIFVQADRNQLRGNLCVRNGTCVIVAPGSRNVVAGNRSSRDGTGIGVEKGRGNLVARNVVLRARRTGIYLGLDEPPIGGAGNVVRGNRIRGSGGDGVHVRAKDRHSLLVRNIATGSGDDGFDVESRSAKLTGNRALHSTDLGIKAVAGVIDAGGNTASGNGNPLQCLNVFCR